MGLIHPADLDAWQAWQRHQNRARSLVGRVRPDHVAPTVLTLGSDDADVLVALDSTSKSSGAALVEPARMIEPGRLAVLSSRPRRDLVDEAGVIIQVSDERDVVRAVPRLRVALCAGDYLPTGALATAATRSVDGTTFVVQHGLLTPHAPPLPTECTLLAWSEADGEFWRSGRDDVTVDVVGSQLLWQAAQRPRVEVDPGADPIFLGQLHGAEISRHEMARISTGFCRATGAHYRPHPSEVDKLSRAQHALMRRRGVRFADTATPLDETATPVVGVFSTGILEAAAHQVPAWAYHPAPPAWIEDLWERYGLNPWGLDPTPPPALPESEPARRIAGILQQR